jgi:hypothetical protein
MLPTSPHKYFLLLTASSHSPRLAHQPSSNLEQRPSRTIAIRAIIAITSWLHTSPTTTSDQTTSGTWSRTQRYETTPYFDDLPPIFACLSLTFRRRVAIIKHNAHQACHNESWTSHSAVRAHSEALPERNDLDDTSSALDRLAAARPDLQARFDIS